MPKNALQLRKQILELTAVYAEQVYQKVAFVPGQSEVPVSGKVLGATELQNLVDASLDGWLTVGRFNEDFEHKLAHRLAVKSVLTVNSGSSANLIAVSALTSHLLGERQLRPGDEVITVAAGFPTTINSIIQNGLIPVFVDVDIPTYNVDPDALEAAVSERTRAIVLAHALGNPFDLESVLELARRHDLWLIEDCCDALGSTYKGRLVGSFGDVGTLSFYPAHHITMGEGGAVFTANSKLKRAMESLRDWGRDCWCPPGRDNTCGKRFGWSFEGLPVGYDHKYVYSHLGYNLKITDMQAAAGCAQLDRLDGFIRARRDNFEFLHQGLGDLQDVLILPQATPGSEPSWFGFPLTVRDDAPFRRDDLIKTLNERKIGTRLLFGGDLTRQPYMRDRKYRISGDLVRTSQVMRETFWLGVYPGLDEAMLAYVVDCIHQFVASEHGSR